MLSRLRYGRTIGGIVLLLLLAEGIFFLRIRLSAAPQGRYDLLVLFQGGGQRTDQAYQLLHQGGIAALHIPGASRTALQLLDARHGLPDGVRHLAGPVRTRNTFEDALQASQIIRASRVQRVLLVTSDYHLPRSYLLLRLLTMRSGTAIDTLGLPSRNSPLAALRLNLGELAKVWSSFWQMGVYLLRGNR